MDERACGVGREGGWKMAVSPTGSGAGRRQGRVTNDEVAASRARLTDGSGDARAWTATDPRRSLKG